MPRDLPPEELCKLHFGLKIERQAERWYLERFPSATLLARGFRWRGGEIDLIFEEPLGDRSGRLELVFVEVRARLAGAWVGGIESVGPVKVRRLKTGITIYLARYHGRAFSVRLDLLGWDGKVWEHLRGVT